MQLLDVCLKEADGEKKKKKKEQMLPERLNLPVLRSLCALFIHVLMYGGLLLADTVNAAHGQDI